MQPNLALDAVFAPHIAAGTVGLVSGVVAIFARKGARLHRRAGTVFFASMLVMAAFADVLAVVMPGQLINLFIGTFTLYLVATAWMTARRREGAVWWGEKLALAVILLLAAPFVLLSSEVALGLPTFFHSAVPIVGPVLIALYGFTAVTLIAGVADLRVVFGGALAGRARVERHLWRMGLGLALAAGSAFTNGFPRLLPKSVHVPLFVLFVPQLAALALMLFWLIRVRFWGLGPRAAAAATP